MKKYHMAWINSPMNGYVILGSTDTTLVQWFLDELKKIVPTYELADNTISEMKDLNGNVTYVTVRKLNNKDSEIKYWLLQELLEMEWEPFSVSKSFIAGTGDTDVIYLRKETVTE